MLVDILFTRRQGQCRHSISVIPLISHFAFPGYMCWSHLDSTLLGLNISILDLAMVNDNGIATGATGSIVGPTNALGELGFGVRQEKLCTIVVSLDSAIARNITHNLIVLDLVGLAPGTHHKGIIKSDYSNNIDALLAELGQVLNVARDMVDGASGGEGALIWSHGVLAVKLYRIVGYPQLSVKVEGTLITYRAPRIEPPSCLPIPWRRRS